LERMRHGQPIKQEPSQIPQWHSYGCIFALIT
jgi:hypothetical protein